PPPAPRRPPSPLFPYTTLFRSATAVRRAFDARPKDPDVISNSAARANVRLVRFQSQPPLLSVLDDSRQGPTNSADVAQDPLALRSEEHTSELQSLRHLVCRLLL